MNSNYKKTNTEVLDTVHTHTHTGTTLEEIAMNYYQRNIQTF